MYILRFCYVAEFIFRAILKKEFHTLMKGMRGNVSSYANIMMELKKCANHAYLVAPPQEEPLAKDRIMVGILINIYILKKKK